jgi:dienelactone hydrolase
MVVRLGWGAALLTLGASMTAAQPVASTPSSRPSVPRPVGDFAQLPFMMGPELSPSGISVASRMSVKGEQVFSVHHLFDAAKPMAIVGLGDNELLDWTWVNEDWLVLRIGATAQVEGTTIYVTRILGVSADGKTIKPIMLKDGGQSARVIWTAKDGSPRVLMSMQKSIYLETGFWPSVSEIDVSTGRVRQVVDGIPGVMNWYADPSGNVRMGIGYADSTRTSRLLYRPTGKGPFKTVDRANAKAEDELTVPILMSDLAQPALTVSAHEGFEALYALDLATLTIGKRIFGAERYDIDHPLRSDDGTLLGVAWTNDRARVHWLDADLAKVQADLDKAVAPRSARIVSWNRDRKRLLVHVADASQPGSYFYYDAAAGGAMKRIAFVNEAIKGQALGPVSSFRYKARDGMEIEALLTLPRGRETATGLPLVLMPHGGPEARDAAAYDWWAQFLADRGYAVVQPNYRGSTGYGRAFQDAGDGEWGLKMQDDLNDAVDALAAKRLIDPKRVCIVGGSYGGYAALRGAQRDGSRYRCAVSFAGVADLNGMMSYDGRFLNANARRAGWRKTAPDLRAVSPINHAATFGAPVLLVHGKKDLRVPVAQSRHMAAKLTEAGKPHDYVELPLADHHLSREADRTAFLERLEAFLAKHNPA